MYSWTRCRPILVSPTASLAEGATAIAHKDKERQTEDYHRAKDKGQRCGLIVAGGGIEHMLLRQQLEIDQHLGAIGRRTWLLYNNLLMLHLQGYLR